VQDGRVNWGYAGALGAAVFYGTASVLQAVGARRVRHGAGLDPRVLARVAVQWPFLAGVGLDLLGFVMSLVALRFLPLFAVQAAIAANLAVTALLASAMLRVRLRGREWASVGCVCAGLALLGVTAAPEAPVSPGPVFGFVLLGVAVLVGAAAVAVAPRRWAAPVLGALAGLGFGLTSVAVRVIPDLAFPALLRTPATYVVAIGGLTGLMCLTSAFQRGSVTAVTGTMVAAETLAPALVGLLLLGDRSRAGLGALATAGFVLAVAGAALLARFGELEPASREADAS
jgi:drug/metabolite transporter (DMT)-like permease